MGTFKTKDNYTKKDIKGTKIAIKQYFFYIYRFDISIKKSCAP